MTKHQVQDCFEVGIPPLRNMDECEEAASSFGFTYYGAGYWVYLPKGCYVDVMSKIVRWNGHESGNVKSGTLAICQASGKYRVRYSI